MTKARAYYRAYGITKVEIESKFGISKSMKVSPTSWYDYIFTLSLSASNYDFDSHAVLIQTLEYSTKDSGKFQLA